MIFLDLTNINQEEISPKIDVHNLTNLQNSFQISEKNNSPIKQINEKEDILTPAIFQNRNYNKLYNNLKEKLGIQKYLRKLDFDSSLKKIKAKVFKTIHNCIKACVREYMIIRRLPQSFIVDIRIDSNKNLFDLTINEIYKIHNIDLNFNKLLEEDFIRPEKEELLRSFLSSKFIEIFHFFRGSKQYEREKKKYILNNNNKNFGIIFDYTIDNYKNYFFSSRGNRKLKKQKFNFKVINSDELNNMNTN